MNGKLRLTLCVMMVFGALIILSGLNTPTASAANSSEPEWDGSGGYYKIDNVEELQYMGNDLDNDYILTGDIDASATSSWNGDNGFDPIGDSSNNFVGSFNGNDYVIENLYIDRGSTANVGLFGYTDSGAVIENVGVVNENITGDNKVGGLVGYTSGGSVSNCYSTGSVTGNKDVGGLVGYIFQGSVSNSYSAAENVTGSGDYVGGLVGFSWDSVDNCYSTGSVSGVGYVGGLVGQNNNGGSVSNCYSTGSVTGSGNRVGGLVGYNSENVSNSYSTAENVTGSSVVGGFVGYDGYGSYENSFWDNEICNQNQDLGSDGNLENVFAKSTSEMRSESTFTGAGWDFENVWGIDDGKSYPYLVNNEQIPHPYPYQDETFYVDNDWVGEAGVPTDLTWGVNAFASIENAVNNADSVENNTIRVFAGIYDDSLEFFPIIVDKENLKIISENGPGETLVDVNDGTTNGFELTADNITLSGFTVTDANSGFSLSSSDNNTLENNLAENNWNGFSPPALHFTVHNPSDLKLL